MSNSDAKQHRAGAELDRASGVWRGFLADPPRIRVAARCIVKRTSDAAIIRSLDELPRQALAHQERA